MNSHFRRDYLYQAQEDIKGVVLAHTFLRYLKFNRKNQEYLFLTGGTPNDKEELVVLPANQINRGIQVIKRQHCAGYERTNGYSDDIGDIITNSKDMELGRSYRFITNSGSPGICNSKLFHSSLDHTGKMTFDLNETDTIFNTTQVCYSKWLDGNRLTARLVG